MTIVMLDNFLVLESIIFLTLVLTGNYGNYLVLFFSVNSLWKSSKSEKNYKHKIVRHMRVNKSNKPSHSNITSTCEIFKYSDTAIFGIILLASCCFHRHFPLFNY